MAYEFALAIIGILAVIIAIAVFVYQAEKKRRTALADMAHQMGLAFHPGGRDDILAHFGHLEAMDGGLRRRTRNVLFGLYRGVEVRIFDFIYETESRDSKGNTTRQTHRVSVGLANTPTDWPKLTIVPETIGHKVLDALGGDDIDFESTEFSRKFWVKCKDRKFAYDVLHPRAMELLLAAEWKKWQLMGSALCVWKDNQRLDPKQIGPVLERMIAFLGLLPTFRRPPQLTIGPRPTGIAAPGATVGA